jgi:hypothetical protein
MKLEQAGGALNVSFLFRLRAASLVRPRSGVPDRMSRCCRSQSAMQQIAFRQVALCRVEGTLMTVIVQREIGSAPETGRGVSELP